MNADIVKRLKDVCVCNRTDFSYYIAVGCGCQACRAVRIINDCEVALDVFDVSKANDWDEAWYDLDDALGDAVAQFGKFKPTPPSPSLWQRFHKKVRQWARC